MEVRNCKGCGRLYNYISGLTYANYCPKCLDELEDKFEIAKEYIREHSVANIEEVAEVANVNTRQIERWIREERLTFTDDSPVGIPCEKCGRIIKSGKYCADCKDRVAKAINGIYETKKNMEKKKNTNNSMRFLDKH